MREGGERERGGGMKSVGLLPVVVVVVEGRNSRKKAYRMMTMHVCVSCALDVKKEERKWEEYKGRRGSTRGGKGGGRKKEVRKHTHTAMRAMRRMRPTGAEGGPEGR